MRKIPKDEIIQRGCKFCFDVTWKRKGFAWFCPFEKCPYHDLDDIKNFVEETLPGGKFETVIGLGEIFTKSEDS